MRRALYVSLALLLLLVVVAGGLWYFSYGMSTAPPRRATVAGLERSVEIEWNDAGVATIHADSTADEYAALGYAHGTQRPYLVALLRQTATGRLGEWFGEGTLPLDRLARRLGFADLARQAFADLSDDNKALLRAYAGGMNAALSGRAARNSSEFALINRTPDAYEPWHPLAIERLYAYLATTPPSTDSLSAAPAAARRFLQADSTLRRWLSLHDFTQSAAWAVRDSASTHLFYRHVYGSSAIPLLQAVLVQRSNSDDLSALSLPGTPFLVAGRSGAQAWAMLPSGTALEMVRAPRDTTTTPLYERILGEDGREHLVTVHRSPQGLLLSAPPAADSTRRLRMQRRDSLNRGAAPASPQAGGPSLGGTVPADSARVDSVWQVRWAGFTPVSDMDGWQALPRGIAGSSGAGSGGGFQLLQAGGITADSSGSFQLFGTPARAVRFERGLVTGHPTWTPYLAAQVEARLTQVLRDSTGLQGGIQPQEWVQADSSAWAARLAPDLMASIDSLSRTGRGTFAHEERTDIFGQAIRYLRNWDFAYDGPSIGASIFDTWAAEYRRATGGQLPVVRASIDSLAASDSLRTLEDRRRFELFSDAVSRLARQYGEDIEQWRWESVASDTRRFPGWSADSLGGRRLQSLASTRYAPIEIPGGGHPSTLNWGASPASDGLPAPAAYEAWIGTDRWKTLFIRRRRFDTGTPFGRYRAQRSAPDPIALRFDTMRARRSTILAPAGTTNTSAGPQRAEF